MPMLRTEGTRITLRQTTIFSTAATASVCDAVEPERKADPVGEAHDGKPDQRERYGERCQEQASRQHQQLAGHERAPDPEPERE